MRSTDEAVRRETALSPGSYLRSHHHMSNEFGSNTIFLSRFKASTLDMLLCANSVLSLGAVYSVMVETIFNSSRLYDYASPLPALGMQTDLAGERTFYLASKSHRLDHLTISSGFKEDDER
jgi:hypothetical protein